MKILCFDIKYTGWTPERFKQRKIRKEVLQYYVEKNSKICAIKRYRELTGLGLKDAKEYCDSLAEEAERLIALRNPLYKTQSR